MGLCRAERDCKPLAVDGRRAAPWSPPYAYALPVAPHALPVALRAARTAVPPGWARDAWPRIGWAGARRWRQRIGWAGALASGSASPGGQFGPLVSVS